MKINQWYKGYSGYRMYLFSEILPNKFIGLEVDTLRNNETNVDVWNITHSVEKSKLEMSEQFMDEARKSVLKNIFSEDDYYRSIL